MPRQRILSRGDLLALIDRAAPIVGLEQQASDPVAGCMLRDDAIQLLNALSQRLTGLPVTVLVAGQAQTRGGGT